MCKRWADDFVAFFADMGSKPAGMTLDRIDVNGNYEPGNCRWATPKEQARNTRTNVWVLWRGKRMILKAVAEAEGVSYRALHQHFRRDGKSIAEAIAASR